MRALCTWLLLAGALAGGAAQAADETTVTYEYDTLGRLVRVVYAGIGEIRYAYDAASNLLSRIVSTTPPCAHTYELPAGWSMISLPCEVTDASRTALFPTAISLFAFGNGYQPADTLRPGAGYWINLPAAATVTLPEGAAWPEAELTEALPAGWSMVGVGATRLSVPALRAAYGFLISVFGFANGYVAPDTLEPGSGYWTNLAQAGSMDLSGAVGAVEGAGRLVAPAGGAAPEAAPGVWLAVEAGAARQVLRLGVQPEELVALPPRPPAGAFDARLSLGAIEAWAAPSGDDLAEYPLHLQGPVDSLRWQAPAASSGEWVLVVGGSAFGLDGEGALAPPAGIQLSVRRLPGRPRAFALHPNYPNPFNPTTTIRYDLPEVRRVSLRIHDVTGQLVRQLVAGEQPAGRHQVEWDGRNDRGKRVASGVYFCELRAGDDLAVQRMLLMK